MDILGNNQINIVLTAPLLYIENFIIITPKKRCFLLIFIVNFYKNQIINVLFKG